MSVQEYTHTHHDADGTAARALNVRLQSAYVVHRPDGDRIGYVVRDTIGWAALDEHCAILSTDLRTKDRAIEWVSER
jgi:hypothetical protein